MNASQVKHSLISLGRENRVPFSFSPLLRRHRLRSKSVVRGSRVTPFSVTPSHSFYVTKNPPDDETCNFTGYMYMISHIWRGTRITLPLEHGFLMDFLLPLHGMNVLFQSKKSFRTFELYIKTSSRLRCPTVVSSDVFFIYLIKRPKEDNHDGSNRFSSKRRGNDNY
jgi:hypothetical protein